MSLTEGSSFFGRTSVCLEAYTRFSDCPVFFSDANDEADLLPEISRVLECRVEVFNSSSRRLNILLESVMYSLSTMVYNLSSVFIENGTLYR